MLNINHIQHYPIGGENALRVIYKKRTSRIEGVYKDTVLIYDCNDVDDEADIKDIKPLLRPLSDLYKERNGKVDIVELAKIYDQDFDVEEDYKIGTTTQYPTEGYVDYWTNDGLECRFGWYGSFQAGYINPNKHLYVKNQLALFQYLFENHYDVFSLIEKGLAIDINTVEI